MRNASRADCVTRRLSRRGVVAQRRVSSAMRTSGLFAARNPSRRKRHIASMQTHRSHSDLRNARAPTWVDVGIHSTFAKTLTTHRRSAPIHLQAPKRPPSHGTTLKARASGRSATSELLTVYVEPQAPTPSTTPPKELSSSWRPRGVAPPRLRTVRKHHHTSGARHHPLTCRRRSRRCGRGLERDAMLVSNRGARCRRRVRCLDGAR